MTEDLDRLDVLAAAEIDLFREGLRTAPTMNFIGPASLLEYTTAEWADRCRRLLATYDAAVRERDELRAANEQLRIAITGFRWLGNNLHNRETAQFRLYFNAALDDAQKAMGDDWEPMRLPDRAALGDAMSDGELDALARQLHESIADGQTLADTAKLLRILTAEPDVERLVGAVESLGCRGNHKVGYCTGAIVQREDVVAALRGVGRG